MKLKTIALALTMSSVLSACVVAPPHARYGGGGGGIQVAVQAAPVYAPEPVYYPQIVVSPWINPFLGFGFWRGHHGGHGAYGGGHGGHRR